MGRQVNKWISGGIVYGRWVGGQVGWWIGGCIGGWVRRWVDGLMGMWLNELVNEWWIGRQVEKDL